MEALLWDRGEHQNCRRSVPGRVRALHVLVIFPCLAFCTHYRNWRLLLELGVFCSFNHANVITLIGQSVAMEPEQTPVSVAQPGSTAGLKPRSPMKSTNGVSMCCARQSPLFSSRLWWCGLAFGAIPMT